MDESGMLWGFPSIKEAFDGIGVEAEQNLKL
jgi:hypothetical protein